MNFIVEELIKYWIRNRLMIRGWIWAMGGCSIFALIPRIMPFISSIEIFSDVLPVISFALYMVGLAVAFYGAILLDKAKRKNKK